MPSLWWGWRHTSRYHQHKNGNYSAKVEISIIYIHIAIRLISILEGHLYQPFRDWFKTICNDSLNSTKPKKAAYLIKCCYQHYQKHWSNLQRVQHHISLSSELRMSCTAAVAAVIVLRPGLKPNCCGWRTLLSSRKPRCCQLSRDSRILDTRETWAVLHIKWILPEVKI